MTVKNAGVAVIETYLQPPQPYRLWFADLLVCPVCLKTVISGFADRAFIGNWQDDFGEKCDALIEGDLAKQGLIFYDNERPT